MLSELPVSIFLEWYDHYMEEPWGYELKMAQHAELCCYVVNGLYHPKSPYKISDFYPKPEEQKKKPDWQDWKAALKAKFK